MYFLRIRLKNVFRFFKLKFKMPADKFKDFEENMHAAQHAIKL